MTKVTTNEVKEVIREELKGKSADIKRRMINAIRDRVNYLRDDISSSMEACSVVGIFQSEHYNCPWGIRTSIVRQLIVKHVSRFGFKVTGTIDGIEAVGLSDKTYNEFGEEV